MTQQDAFGRKSSIQAGRQVWNELHLSPHVRILLQRNCTGLTEVSL